MKTLTQVWLIVMTLCFILLLVGFQIAGRLGLFGAFLISLFLIYLVMYRGLKLFLMLTQAKEISGTEPTGFKSALIGISPQYQLQSIKLYVTSKNLPPMVWSEFSNNLVIVVSDKFLERLTINEKKLLAHLLLSHGLTYAHLIRRFLGLFSLATQPFIFLSWPSINFLTVLSFLTDEVYKGDLLAFKNSQATQLEFGLFLHKLHHAIEHRNNKNLGLAFFSIVNFQSSVFFKLYKLNSKQTLIKREKNILGYSL